ncbi:hypothetical protein C8F01DRAFT_1082537 [Mycena amicta]|nr:hypothetical protein C8F01DRAFT_1082537 [Mycena amicta]
MAGGYARSPGQDIQGLTPLHEWEQAFRANGIVDARSSIGLSTLDEHAAAASQSFCSGSESVQPCQREVVGVMISTSEDDELEHLKEMLLQMSIARPPLRLCHCPRCCFRSYFPHRCGLARRDHSQSAGRDHFGIHRRILRFLAAALSSGPGNGSSGFFRKKSLVGDEDEEEWAQEELRLKIEHAEKMCLEQLEKERLENEEKAAENARFKEERIEKEERLEKECVEKTHLEQLEKTHLEQLEKERLEQLEKDHLEKERVEKLRRKEEQQEKECLENEEKAHPEKEEKRAGKGGKRKAAEAELEQDDSNPRCTSRARKTPAQAEEERQLKAASTVGKKAKPGQRVHRDPRTVSIIVRSFPPWSLMFYADFGPCMTQAAWDLSLGPGLKSQIVT